MFRNNNSIPDDNFNTFSPKGKSTKQFVVSTIEPIPYFLERKRAEGNLPLVKPG